MADQDDWRAQRAAKLVGTPFERPREPARSRLDDTLPIQRASTAAPSSTSAQPRVNTTGAAAMPQAPPRPAPSIRPKPSFALRGWGIAAAFVAALVGTFAYLLSGGLNSTAVERSSPAKLPAVASAASASRPLTPQPAAPVVVPAPIPVTHLATLATAPVLNTVTTKPVTPKAEPSRVKSLAQADHSRVAVAQSNTGAKDDSTVPERIAPTLNHSKFSERSAAADRHTAVADRRAAVTDHRAAAVEHRDVALQNTVFATARKTPTAAVPMPPCDLSNRAEAAVCASPALNALRRQVHDLYVGVGTDGDPKLIAKAQREQASFLKHRDRCKDNACLNRQYTHQIEALQKLRIKAAAARVRAAAKTLPTCAAGQRPSPAQCRPAHHRISLKKLLGIKHT